MIAVDTSAVMAILLGEPEGERCALALEAIEDLLLSAGTLAEILVVASRRGYLEEAVDLVENFGFTVVPVTSIDARRVGEAYGRWGKGLHPAALNFGDCFAYVLAKDRGCPLLFIGNDFSRTDITAA